MGIPVIANSCTAIAKELFPLTTFDREDVNGKYNALTELLDSPWFLTQVVELAWEKVQLYGYAPARARMLSAVHMAKENTPQRAADASQGLHIAKTGSNHRFATIP